MKIKERLIRSRRAFHASPMAVTSSKFFFSSTTVRFNTKSRKIAEIPRMKAKKLKTTLATVAIIAFILIRPDWDVTEFVVWELGVSPAPVFCAAASSGILTVKTAKIKKQEIKTFREKLMTLFYRVLRPKTFRRPHN